ncbi:MAG: phage minor head protein [Chloroherpetonaceae bacterium]|nr:phage minor head protein [Chloroherpetonaceae bacterium]
MVNQEFDKAGVTRLSKWHLDVVYRTNTAIAYSGGQTARYGQLKSEFPFWRYSAIKDRRTRPSHRRLDGKIFKNGDFRFWPPLGYNCRCEAIPITAREAAEKGFTAPDPVTPEEQSALRNAEFIGNKNSKFMSWLEKKNLSPEAKKKVDMFLMTLMSDLNPKMPVAVKKVYEELKATGEFIEVKSSSSSTFILQHKRAQKKDLPLNLDASRRLSENGYNVIIRAHIENKGKQPEFEIINSEGKRFISDLKTPNPKEYKSLVSSIKNQFASAEKQKINHLVVDIIDPNADNFNIEKGIEDGFKNNRFINTVIILKGEKSVQITRDQFLKQVVNKEIKRKL